MIRISLFVIALLTIVSCSINKYPEFVNVSTIDVTEYSSEKITIQSDLVFNNPNHLGGTLKATNIKVMVNNIGMGYINTPDFKVPAQNEFMMPITFEFPFAKIIQDKENLLLNVLNTLTEKKLEVVYTGTITYKFKLFSYDYPLEYSQEISLKKN